MQNYAFSFLTIKIFINALKHSAKRDLSKSVDHALLGYYIPDRVTDSIWS